MPPVIPPRRTRPNGTVALQSVQRRHGPRRNRGRDHSRRTTMAGGLHSARTRDDLQPSRNCGNTCCRAVWIRRSWSGKSNVCQQSAGRASRRGPQYMRRTSSWIRSCAELQARGIDPRQAERRLPESVRARALSERFRGRAHDDGAPNLNSYEHDCLARTRPQAAQNTRLRRLLQAPNPSAVEDAARHDANRV